MKKIIFLLFVLLLLCGEGETATLADLIADLREIVGEKDSSKSSFTDTVAQTWINLAQANIVSIGGYIPKYWDTAISDAGIAVGYQLPSDFVSVRSGLIKHDSIWYSLPKYPFFSADTNVARFSIIWFNEDSAFLLIKDDAILEKSTYLEYSPATLRYGLPLDFRYETGVMARSDGQWYSLHKNPSFVKDTNLLEYTIEYVSHDSAELMLGLGGFLRKSLDIKYTDTNTYGMPADFRELIGTEIKSDGDWFQAMFNPFFIIDTNVLQTSLNIVDGDSATLTIKDGRLLRKATDIEFSENTDVDYILPSDFFEIIGAGVKVDTSLYQL
ncbi:MAG: hypothetical protein ACE5D6_08670 [Candidatus Zixiibacteriota bacterium]